jgi:hypothetical protein
VKYHLLCTRAKKQNTHEPASLLVSWVFLVLKTVKLGIVAYFFNKCFNYFAVRLSAEGGEIMGIPSLLRDLLISVIAGLIANAVFHVLIG